MRQSFFDYCRQYHKEALLREWDTARNAPLTPQAVTYGSLTPEMVTAGSRKKVWWECPLGHVWKAAIYSRTGKKKCGCPVCAGKARK